MSVIDSEVVISFLNKADPFSRVCLFCNFVRNRIYVLEIEMFGPVVLARYARNGRGIVIGMSLIFQIVT
jgi:hypothetical protein